MVSELEKKRLENIARNQKALREFQLKEAADLAFPEVKKEAKKESRRVALGTSNRDAKRQRVERQRAEREPRRRNLRRHGISDEDKKFLLLDSASHAPPEVKPEPITRKEGELQVKQCMERGEWDQAVEIMHGLGKGYSAADLFAPETKLSDESLDLLRSELSGLDADARDIRVVPERCSSIAFHPTASKKVIFAGDKLGNFGLWDASLPEDEGLLSFQFHTKGIATIYAPPDDPEKVYTGSYDGSVRVLDLQAQKSVEAFVYEDIEAGISDFAIVDNSKLYYSTLDGHFGVHDLRTKASQPALVLSDKKIGGFSVNPLGTSYVATASLDRTLKVWDLRHPYQLDVEEGYEAPGAMLCGTYPSRLSISASSWNTSGQIVCNGYDNTINVFDLSTIGNNEELTPTVKIAHNCQTGRWVSILKARWQERPKDGVQKFVIGNMKRYADVFAGSGQQLAHLDADHLTAVPAVSQFHRTENWIAGGNASGKVYLWFKDT